MEGISARNFDRVRDFEAFRSFLRKRGDTSPVSFEFFPPTGALVCYWGKPVCAGFMIKCDNGTVINTDIISDPDVESEIRNAAVIELRKFLAEKAREAGFHYVIATTDQPKLVSKLKEQGYTILKENLTHLGRVLWP